MPSTLYGLRSTHPATECQYIGDILVPCAPRADIGIPNLELARHIDTNQPCTTNLAIGFHRLAGRALVVSQPCAIAVFGNKTLLSRIGLRVIDVALDAFERNRDVACAGVKSNETDPKLLKLLQKHACSGF